MKWNLMISCDLTSDRWATTLHYNLSVYLFQRLNISFILLHMYNVHRHPCLNFQFQIDDALCQLLSAHFQEFSPDFFDAPREFSLVGCALFHRGLLVSNLMATDSMIDAFLMCRYNLTLPLTQETPGTH